MTSEDVQDTFGKATSTYKRGALLWLCKHLTRGAVLVLLVRNRAAMPNAGYGLARAGVVLS